MYKVGDNNVKVYDLSVIGDSIFSGFSLVQ